MRSLASKSLLVSLLLLVAAPLPVASCFAQERARPDATIWIGQSGGFNLKWTTGDLTAAPVSDPAKIVFSAREIAVRKFAAFKKENYQADPAWQCSYSLRFTVLGLAGSLLSYQESEDSYCGRINGGGWNHPSDQTQYRVIDLNQPAVPISLAKFFSEASVLEALLADSTVKEALRNAESSTRPKTVGDLVKTINEGAEIKPVKATAEAPEGCGFVFPEHPFTEFAFHHLEKGKVAVRLSLEPSSGACHSSHSQLGILLPMPSALQAALTAAQSRTQGFLMESTRRLSAGKATVFAFETAGSKQTRKP